MAAIWIVLLDVSGSMGEGFSSSPTQDPLAERGTWHTKLEAAKDLLLRQIAATRVQDVAVFSFADRAHRLFHGARSEFLVAEAAIRAIQADGLTNLAGALEAVAQDPDFERYSAISVLVLSDGLANVGNPVAAAERLIEKYPFARIDTILIDETEEGKQIAENVSINGWVKPAFSYVQLGQEVEHARASSLRQELAGFANRRLELESELSLIAGVPVPILLTVTSPLELTASSLRNDVAPTLEAFELFQHTVDDISGLPYQGAIRSISQSSPVSISLAGLREAVELALEWIIPWRRENARKLAELNLRQIELQNLDLEIRLARERSGVEKAELENRQLELEIANSKLALAERLLREQDPDGKLKGRRRQKALENFIHGIDRLGETTMEFRVSGPNFEDRRRIGQ